VSDKPLTGNKDKETDAVKQQQHYEVCSEHGEACKVGEGWLLLLTFRSELPCSLCQRRVASSVCDIYGLLRAQQYPCLCYK